MHAEMSALPVALLNDSFWILCEAVRSRLFQEEILYRASREIFFFFPPFFVIVVNKKKFISVSLLNLHSIRTVRFFICYLMRNTCWAMIPAGWRLPWCAQQKTVVEGFNGQEGDEKCRAQQPVGVAVNAAGCLHACRNVARACDERRHRAGECYSLSAMPSFSPKCPYALGGSETLCIVARTSESNAPVVKPPKSMNRL